ncbi:unnamed protein product [Cylicostephanus goldi]|uniref:Uncharacterized protein n=1 Tax=Cylicostephanus goldi TaxID=71465 RepID=A0A3P7QCR7_CYLGO|nr:unnamed protein product [Cylicostephanus goldi]
MTPLLNCDEFNINNGVPVTMNVPTPTHPNQPTQIVFYGNNFVSPMGGAIFLQDILLQGNLECNGMSRENYPVLYQGRETEEALLPEQARAEKSQEISKPLKVGLGTYF